MRGLAGQTRLEQNISGGINILKTQLGANERSQNPKEKTNNDKMQYKCIKYFLNL